MDELRKIIREVKMTYFKKITKADIDSIKVGEIFYAKIYNHLNYGSRTLSYYLKMVNKTDKFLDVSYYCDGNEHMRDACCRTEDMLKKELIVKRFAKSRVIEIYAVETVSRIEKIESYTNRPVEK